MSQTPSVQSSQHNPSLSSSYVAAPPQYDGRADGFWDWACALALYIKANAAKFPDDKSQIFCALSYLRGSPRTIAYSTVKTRAYCIQNTAVPKWDDFFKDVQKQFQPANKKEQVMQMLNTLHQAKMTAEEYFLQFNMTADLAGWTAANFDATKIQVANTHLNRSLVNKIYYAADVPDTWEKYQEATIKIDHNWQLRQGTQLQLFHRPSYQSQSRHREDV